MRQRIKRGTRAELAGFQGVFVGVMSIYRTGVIGLSGQMN